MKELKKKFVKIAFTCMQNSETWRLLGHYSGILFLILYGVYVVRFMQLFVLDLIEENGKTSHLMLWAFSMVFISVAKILDARSFAPFGQVHFRIPTVIHIVHLLVPSIFSTIAIFGDFVPKLTAFEISFIVGLAMAYIVIYIFYSFCYWKYVNLNYEVEEEGEEGKEEMVKLEEV